MNYFIIFTFLTLFAMSNAYCKPNFTTIHTINLARVNSCLCATCTYSYKFPSGHVSVDVKYNYSTKVAQDFYQNNILIGRCPAGLYCITTFVLDPLYETRTNITQVTDLYKMYDMYKSYNLTNGSHILLFNPE